MKTYHSCPKTIYHRGSEGTEDILFLIRQRDSCRIKAVIPAFYISDRVIFNQTFKSNKSATYFYFGQESKDVHVNDIIILL